MNALAAQASTGLAQSLAGSWWGHFTGIIILMLMAVFIGIWVWAWRPRHRRTFERLARMPMEDMRSGSNRVEGSAADEEDRS